MIREVLVFLFLIFILQDAWAQEQNSTSPSPSAPACINKAPEGNQKLIESFKGNLDPLKIAFIEARIQMEKTLDVKCAQNQGKIPVAILSDFSKSLPLAFKNTPFYTSSAPEIRRDCIAASMQRTPGNKGYTCDYPSPGEVTRGLTHQTQSIPHSYGTASGSTLQCINSDLLDYVYFSVNSAIQCMSSDPPIDSRVLFKKFNNETAFNFSIASKDGVGLGQATTPSVKELTLESANGRYILENIAKSDKTSCKAFKKIAQDDLKSRPQIHPRNYCAWVNSGEGLSRALIYNIGYYLVLRDHYIPNALESRSPALASHKDLINAFASVSYGPEGLKGAKWLMDKFRVKNIRSPKDVAALLKKIQKQSTYQANTEEKMREVYCIKKGLAPHQKCSSIKLTEAELRGDLCVAH